MLITELDKILIREMDDDDLKSIIEDRDTINLFTETKSRREKFYELFPQEESNTNDS